MDFCYGLFFSIFLNYLRISHDVFWPYLSSTAPLISSYSYPYIPTPSTSCALFKKKISSPFNSSLCCLYSSGAWWNLSRATSFKKTDCPSIAPQLRLGTQEPLLLQIWRLTGLFLNRLCTDSMAAVSSRDGKPYRVHAALPQSSLTYGSFKLPTPSLWQSWSLGSECDMDVWFVAVYFTVI